jgi:hypothetical protein
VSALRRAMRPSLLARPHHPSVRFVAEGRLPVSLQTLSARTRLEWQTMFLREYSGARLQFVDKRQHVKRLVRVLACMIAFR